MRLIYARKKYKGFWIEPETGRMDGDRWRIYHSVTGTFSGVARRLQDAREQINEIHASREEYARHAGCEPADLEYVPERARWRYADPLRVSVNKRGSK